MSSPKPARVCWGCLARADWSSAWRLSAPWDKPRIWKELERSLGTNTTVGRRNAALLTELALKLHVDTAQKLSARRTNTAKDVAWVRTQLAGDNAAASPELRGQLAGGPRCFGNFFRGLMNVSLRPLSTKGYRPMRSGLKRCPPL